MEQPPVEPPSTTFDVPPGWKALWSDEFDGGLEKWTPEEGNGQGGWGNEERQFYTGRPENVRTENGLLLITTRREDYGGMPFTSARIKTQGKFSFFPGMIDAGQRMGAVHVEARIRFPPGNGFWGAFWLYPEENRYGGWAQSGEIDIVEAVNSMYWMGQGAHFGGESGFNPISSNFGYTPNPEMAEFVTVGLEWTEGELKYFVNGAHSRTIKARALGDPTAENPWFSLAGNGGPFAPFDMPFHIILNLAVGGRYPNTGNTGEQWPDAGTPFPSTMEVDYVRVRGRPE